MIGIYTLIWLVIILIFGLPLLIYGIFVGDKIRHRLGIWQNTPKGCIWMHASSMGETAQAAFLARQINEISPGIPILLTATTITGYNRLSKEAPKSCYIYQQPLDFPPITLYIARKTSPKILIVIESDLWLGMIWATKKVDGKVFVVSGRISERTVERSCIFKPYFKFLFSLIDRIFARSSEDAENFVRAGAPPDKVSVIGDLKLAASIPQDTPTIPKPNRFPIVIFGSVRPKEEKLVVETAEKILNAFPDALIIIAPRHPERFDPMANLLADKSIDFARRSSGEPTENARVLLLDTVGELRQFYAISDIAVVGGTFADYGGHNPFEPVAFGVPVIHGKYISNNRGLFELLDSSGVAFKVEPERLFQKILELAGDQPYLARLKAKTRQLSKRFSDLGSKYAEAILREIE